MWWVSPWVLHHMSRMFKAWSFLFLPPVNNILTWIPRLLLQQAIAVTKWVEERIFFFDWLFDALVCPGAPYLPKPFEVPLLNTFQVAKALSCLFYIIMEDILKSHVPRCLVRFCLKEVNWFDTKKVNCWMYFSSHVFFFSSLQ